MSSAKFKFKRHASVGAAAAEEDDQFLSECFHDAGDLDILKDCQDARRIIVGRTGIGKTALLRMFEEQNNPIVIIPESLSFNYLANSSILQFFLEAGVKLDLFFKLLWRHVFTIELIKKRYGINNETAKKSFLSRIQGILSNDKKKEKAINYLSNWGEKFWEPTEYRIKEITGRIENQLQGSISAKISTIGLNANAATKLSEEEKIEVVQRGQAVINAIQIRELTDVMNFLNEDVFSDPRSHLYITIDKLDENWIEDKFRYLLIRSLIETIRDFQKVRNIKIIVALRSDLLERVFRLTRDLGFQEEKYRSLFLPLKWNENQLKELLNKRVNYLVNQTHTLQSAGYKDLLPSSIDKKPAVAYMIDRTLLRPRELIEFFNDCIEQAESCPSINKKMLLTAEGEYSKNRLRSLQDEWIADYPTLIEHAFLLRKRPKYFLLGDLNDSELQDFCLDYAVKYPELTDALSLQTKNTSEGLISPFSFVAFIFHVFYRTGIVGLKSESFETTQWSYKGPSTIAANTIDTKTKVQIHPTIWRVLGIKP
jgi:hypothetical protein